MEFPCAGCVKYVILFSHNTRANLSTDTLSSVKVQFCQGLIDLDGFSDDMGLATYQVGDQEGQNVEIRAVADNADQPDLYAFLDGISTLGNADQSNIYLGWKTWSDIEAKGDAWIPFALSGDSSSFVGNNPPSDWMHQSLPYIGCRTLQQIILPGTHDSGMSVIQNSNLATGQNAKTQSLDIYHQLLSGIRYFDIRPVLDNGNWYLGHFDREHGYGADGQALSDVINDIAYFLQNLQNNELLILDVSNEVDRSTNTWNSNNDPDFFLNLINELKKIPYLYTAGPDVTLTTLTLNDFIANGPAVIIRLNTLSGQDLLQDAGVYRQGFFYPEDLVIDGSYADTDNLEAMQKDQYSKFLSWSQNPDANSLFSVSWTQTLVSIVEDVNLLDSIETRADIAYAHLAQYGKPPESTFLYWNSNGKIPNIITIDYARPDRRLPALCLALNRDLWRSKCPGLTVRGADTTTSPTITQRSASTLINKPTTFITSTISRT